MRALITGLNGFTGRYMARELEAKGHEAVGLRADLLDPGRVKEEVAALAPDWVVHLAAISFVPAGNHADVYAVNVLGTQALLEGLLASRRPPQRVVLASSANVYGVREGILGEKFCPAPVNNYGCSKLSMEHISSTYSGCLPIVLTRPFNYTGRGQPEKFVVPKLVEHFRRGAPVIELGNIDVVRDFSDVRWIADAYRELLENESANGVYNLCSGEGVSLRSIIASLHRLTGQTVEVRVNPEFVRANDITRQVGNPARLRTVYQRPPIPIEDTLAWMLASESEQLT